MDDARLIQQKQDARRDMRALRKGLDSDLHRQQSAMACHRLLDQLAEIDGMIIGLFLPILSEIDSSLLVTPLREKGGRLALPVTIGRTGMIFRAWEDDTALIDAGFGTKGPCMHAVEVVPDILVMPLLAFDREGRRLGNGAGHYDRYIGERIIEGNRPRLIGLAFGLQRLDKVPVGRYDLPLDMIVTETEVIAPELVA